MSQVPTQTVKTTVASNFEADVNLFQRGWDWIEIGRQIKLITIGDGGHTLRVWDSCFSGFLTRGHFDSAGQGLMLSVECHNPAVIRFVLGEITERSGRLFATFSAQPAQGRPVGKNLDSLPVQSPCEIIVPCR